MGFPRKKESSGICTLNLKMKKKLKSFRLLSKKQGNWTWKEAMGRFRCLRALYEQSQSQNVKMGWAYKESIIGVTERKRRLA